MLVAIQKGATLLYWGQACSAIKSNKETHQHTFTHATFANLYHSVQVNIPATSGDMGVLANHVPSIEQLKAGVLEIFTDGGSKEDYFVSGGFAIVQPGSKLSINAVEAYKVEDFSKEVCLFFSRSLRSGL